MYWGLVACTVLRAETDQYMCCEVAACIALHAELPCTVVKGPCTLWTCQILEDHAAAAPTRLLCCGCLAAWCWPCCVWHAPVCTTDFLACHGLEGTWVHSDVISEKVSCHLQRQGHGVHVSVATVLLTQSRSLGVSSPSVCLAQHGVQVVLPMLTQS